MDEVILKVRWFTQMGGTTLGIVLVRTVTGQEKAYIGAGTGVDENLDAQYIAETGARFPVEIAQMMDMTRLS